jgi:transposase
VSNPSPPCQTIKCVMRQKPLKQAKTKLVRLQRQASRQVKGSNNQRKTYDKIRQIHAKIACIRKDFLHKLTTYLAQTFWGIKIEDLNVSGMLANHKESWGNIRLRFLRIQATARLQVQNV